MFCCLCGSGNLAALAFEFSPMVEQTAPDAVTFDVRGLDRLFGIPQEIAAAIARRAAETQVKANLAIAENPDAAIHAARVFTGINIIPYGDEAKFLGALPLTLLTPSPELLETLERWGIRRFQDLGALPPLGIAERLGAEGLRLRELARGEAGRKLRLLEDPPNFEDEIELEYPVDLLEPLAFLLARLINGLTTRLATRAQATDELRLRLRLEDRDTHQRTLRLPVPSLDSKSFLKLLQLDLSAHPPAAPVVQIWLGMNPVMPRFTQNSLLVPVAPEPLKLELTLARIRAIVGQTRAGSPQLINSHRPGAFTMRTGERSYPATAPVYRKSIKGPRLAIRLFRPPRPAHVTLAACQPSYVAARNIRGKVLDCAGPWRTSGDWWTVESWARDEWDIALSDGALYRLYCHPGGWFVEGSYD